MIIITNIYQPNQETDNMVKSFQDQGYEVAILNAGSSHPVILKELLECYKRASTGHELFIYADAADTYCQRKLTKKEEEYLSDKLVYSTEKACWPDKSLASKYPKSKSDWKYLNGGIYGGSLQIAIEFFSKYVVGKSHGSNNGQQIQAQAFLKAHEDGFAIELDDNCKLFQSTAFDPANEGNMEDSAFEIVRKRVKNKVTKTTPAILHANGRSDMSWWEALKY